MQFYAAHTAQLILFCNVSTDCLHLVPFIDVCDFVFAVASSVSYVLLFSFICMFFTVVLTSSLLLHLHMTSHISCSYKALQTWVRFGLLHSLPLGYPIFHFLI